MPWWLAAIVFFTLGVSVERFIIDRKFIRQMTRMTQDLAKLMEAGESDAPEGKTLG